MKKIKFVAIVLLASLAFSSCSSDEMFSPEEVSEELFKTYQLKRDINGKYSLDINVEDNISIGKVKFVYLTLDSLFPICGLGEHNKYH